MQSPSGPSGPDYLSILTILVNDGPESELTDRLAKLVRATDAEADQEEIREIADRALDLHRSREIDRSRAQGLTALAETATDLAAHRDVDELLEEICRRARALLGTDMAYVTLLDGEIGDSYVHVTKGVISEAFRTMRIPPGMGLGGLVAQTGEPESTVDYRRDERLKHDADVDSRVEAEGLRAIVAAPLKQGNDVFGVLLSGSREPRHFEPTEVALFASLGSHAAVALETARLIQNSGVMLADLSAANLKLKEHADRMERVGEIYEQLTAVALRDGTVPELLDTVVAQLPGTIELRTTSGEKLEAEHYEGRAEEPSAWVEASVTAASEQLGVLRMGRRALEGIETDILQRTAALAASMLLSLRAQTEGDHRRRSLFLEELLSSQSHNGDELQEIAVRSGIALNVGHVVLVVALPPSAERWAWVRATRATRARRAVVGAVGGRIVVIEPAGESRAIAAHWAETLAAGEGAAPTIGVADASRGAAAIRVAYRDATRSLNILLALGRGGEAATIADLGIFGQMLGHAKEGDLRAFLDRSLGAVRRRDDERQSKLMPTLRAYLEENGHLANTARALGVHINTLYQRLDRLDDLLGEDWRGGDRRLELHVAIRLEALDRVFDGP